jgi:tryptophan halogenase
MSAAALARLIEPAGISVTLVESGGNSATAVGEASIPSIRAFHGQLELDEDDFLRQTRGTFSLGIEFVDWRARGSRYLHPFGSYGWDLQGIKFHQFWLKLRHLGESDTGELADHNLCSFAAKLKRFTRPPAISGSALASLRYAFHVDAGLYAAYLRKYAEARGVRRVEGRIVQVKQRRGDGFISELVLQDGLTVPGELFLDCTGMQAQLISQSLKVGYRDWRRWLPCDRAVTASCDKVAPVSPYTRATADAAGWRWRVPMQHRTGNGYVYCSEFSSEVVAQARLLCQLDGPASSDISLLKFTAGHRWRLWERNCVAIGPAGGFLEPLESTGIHLIQTGIARLLACFPDRSFCASARNAYNRYMTDQYRQIRDFVLLHYKVTERRDTPFWQSRAEVRIPASLQERIELFRANGTVLSDPGDLFPDHSWIAIMLGQGIRPAGYDPLVDSLPLENVRRFKRHIAEVTAQAVQSMPDHDDFIARNCNSWPSYSADGVSDSYS